MVSKRDHHNHLVSPPVQNQAISPLICARKLKLAVEKSVSLERNPCLTERLQVMEDQPHSLGKLQLLLLSLIKRCILLLVHLSGFGFQNSRSPYGII